MFDSLLEILDSLDRGLFVFLNGLYNPVFDFIMLWASDRFIWIPFYAFLVFLIVRKHQWDSIYIYVFVAVAVVMSDQFTSAFMKPFFERFRPCHNPDLREYIHIVGRCGGRFGFASSHAANTFAAATFLWLLFRQYYHWSWLLFVWAGLVSYSRIYLGVHYPGDILVGGLIGAIFAYCMYMLMQWAISKRKGSPNLVRPNEKS